MPKTLTNVTVAPDANFDLATLFYSDGSKLAVSIPKFKPYQRTGSNFDSILAAVESCLRLPNGHLAGGLVGPFSMEYESVLGIECTSGR